MATPTTIDTWQQYQTEPFQVQLNVDAIGGPPVADDITGFAAGNFTAVLRDTSKPNDVPFQGTFTIVAYSPAVLNCYPDAEDVNTPSTTNQLIISRLNANTGKIKVYYPINWTIRPS